MSIACGMSPLADLHRRDKEENGGTTPNPQPHRNTRAARIVVMHDVQPEIVDWIWPGRIPRGKLTLIEGDPGVAKSWLTLAIATSLSIGAALPGDTARP